jgi:hypothetical protein
MTFDAPDANLCTARRDRSNTPLQALTLLNDTVFVECAQALGRRLVTERSDTESRLRHGFRLCVGRDLTAEELARLRGLYDELLALAKQDPAGAAKLAGPKPPAGVAETAAWVAVARVLINLDEFLVRE